MDPCPYPLLMRGTTTDSLRIIQNQTEYDRRQSKASLHPCRVSSSVDACSGNGPHFEELYNETCGTNKTIPDNGQFLSREALRPEIFALQVKKSAVDPYRRNASLSVSGVSKKLKMRLDVNPIRGPLLPRSFPTRFSPLFQETS